jgi:UDP-N-acetylglucosamine 1-carboxyvinyltransferase
VDKMLVEGGKRLKGTVTVSGSKNAALPIMAAALMADGPTVIHDVPRLRDVATMRQILTGLGCKALHDEDGSVLIEVQDEMNDLAPYELVSQMRASVAVLGPLLAKRGRAKVSLPGGCQIGNRPIDLHLKGLRALGATLEIQSGGYVVGEARRLVGEEVYLGGPFGSSVGATCNVMCAACLAEGQTVIINAAIEPEVQDVARYLNAMGAQVSGIGTPRVVIDGVKELKGTTHTVIPDRIEAGTFLIAAAVTNSELVIENARIEHLSAVVDALQGMGITVFRENGRIRVTSRRRLDPVDITTLPYPGFPTDLQAQIMALLAVVDGISVVTEKVFPDRFMHIGELNRLGANIRKEGPNAIIQGSRRLSGAPVMASDLRASAALVLAGLVAEGTTEISRIYHLDRGYDGIDRKLATLGAKIERAQDDAPAAGRGD